MPIHECLYPLTDQTSDAGLGHGVSPILVTRTDPRRQENAFSAGRLTDAHTRGRTEMKEKGRFCVLEEKVEAGTALNGAFTLLQHGTLLQ